MTDETLSAAEVVRRYYDAYAAGDLETTASWVREDCEIDEPDFLPYGRIPITGAYEMFDKIGGVFFRLFEPDTTLENTRYFEIENAVITNCVWVMNGLHTGRQIRCHYQEYFEVRDNRISVMRPFYHAAREIMEEMEAARAKGIEIAPWEPLGSKHNI